MRIRCIYDFTLTRFSLRAVLPLLSLYLASLYLHCKEHAVTVLTPQEIQQVWIQAGGRSDRALVATAVALAESGGDTNAISSTGNYGLWQINRSNFGAEFSVIQWWNPVVNAQFAIRLSRNGTNWGDWCTAWVDPDKYCGRASLPDPQPGSPAYGQLQRLGAMLISAPPRIAGLELPRPRRGSARDIRVVADGVHARCE